MGWDGQSCIQGHPGIVISYLKKTIWDLGHCSYCHTAVRSRIQISRTHGNTRWACWLPVIPANLSLPETSHIVELWVLWRALPHWIRWKSHWGRFLMASSGFNHTGEHTSTCICPCTTYKHEYTHAHHTHPKMGESHRNHVKNRKQSFRWQIPCLFVLWRVCQGITCLSFILLSVSVHVCKWLCVSIF